jgi:tetratricopeptide (TPR) repeat protein
MNISHSRALAVALLLGGAAMAAATMIAPQTAEAATVRPSVGKPLQEAISLANSGHGSEAMAKVHEAESVSGLTGGEQQAIAQTKEYIGAKTGAGGSATGCRAKFANDYNGGRYRDAIADADCLRKSGGLSGQDQLIVAQAYYLSGDYAEAIRAAREAGGPTAQELELSAAFKSGDSGTMRDVLEDLVSEGKTQYWGNLLSSAENTKGLKDHQTLDIYRLRFLTGSLRNDSDYMLAAELAVQLGSPQEAANMVQKGLDAKVLSGDRAVRLLNLAKGQAAKDAAGFPAMQKAADAAKSGDADVKLGEEYWGFGRYPDAISTIQNGIKKGTSDNANAQIRLGQAYLGAGQKDAAVRAFNAVTKDDGNQQVIAHLWSIYARTSK